MTSFRSALLVAVVACGDPKDPATPGETDTPCASATWYADADGDGFGAAPSEACAQPPGAVERAGDCDDAAPEVHPGATERCNDADDDCDSEVDEPDAADAPAWYADQDGDGFGDPGSAETACAAPAGRVADATDCDDAASGVHPGAVEHCDGVDEDCNLTVDDPTAVDATASFEDADGDGHGAPATSVVQCEAPPGWVPAGDDCDDQEPLVSPSATERCDALDTDEDCDGPSDDLDPSVDPASAGDFHADDDGDGFGDPASVVRACDASPGVVADAADCDDGDAQVHPGAAERCDGRDEDCDLVADDAAIDPTPWYVDGDLDGYGDPASELARCSAPPGWIADGRDCDDLDPDRHPGATERCGGTDEDCNGVDDDPYADGALTWYEDLDQDGHGSATSQAACDAPPGWVAVGDDCDDDDGAVSPDATEICDPSGEDEDCDGLADDDDPSVDPTTFLAWHVDGDGDGFGVDAPACDAPASAVPVGGDCDDADATRSPGAAETCDAVDRDCSGDPYDALVGLLTWYPDQDGDGYGDDEGAVDACLAPPGHVAQGGDCDDLVTAAHPGATEVCTDGVDDDCDGVASSDDDCGPFGALTLVAATDTSFGGLVGIGAAVALADLDGDGLDDVVLGAPTSGEVHAFLAPFDDFEGTPDTTFHGPAGFGSALARVRDFDGDGVDDLAIGSPDEDAGAVYVFRGGSGLAASVLAGSAWLRVAGEASGDDAGEVLAGGADVDGDGLGDLLVGAPDAGAEDEGAAYLVRGGTAPAALADADLVLRGELPRDAAGSSLAFAGDVDGDGSGDLLVGACESADRATGAGEVYLVRGPVPQGELELARADASLLGTVVDGEAGCAVAGVGDLDGDGYDDVAVGAPGDGGGSVAVFRGPIHPARHPLASASHVIRGTVGGDRLGAVLAGGDVDGDGRADLVVGASEDGAGGATFVYYGLPGAPALGAVDADATLTGGADLDLPTAVAIGDVDADGFADLLVSATSASGGLGGAWLLRGGPVEPPAGPAAVVDPADDGDGDGWTGSAGDCDDTRAAAAPDRVELCENLLDDDCDGRDDLCAPEGPIDPVAARATFEPNLYTTSEYEGTHVGDVDGDGFPDVLVLGQSLYVYLGPIPWGPWATADADGQISADYDARVEALGDFDGDGIDDFVVTDRAGSFDVDGRAYLFLGGPDLVTRTTLDDADLIIEGKPGGYLEPVSPAGDLNGDGLDDLVLGAGSVDDLYFQGGEAYVFYGGRAPGVWSAADADVVVAGETPENIVGHEVCGAGDLDGDGWPDLLVGGRVLDIPWVSDTVWLLRGPLDPRPDLSAAHAVFLGGSWDRLHPVGDLDGDGYQDLAIPDPSDDRVALFFGPIGPGFHHVDGADLYVVGPSAFGTEVATAGDVDGDGYDDLQVRSVDYLEDVSTLHVFHGPLPRSGVLTADAAGATFLMDGERNFPLGPGGDLDGDGYDDLLVGEAVTDGVHVVRGGRRGDPVAHVVDLDPLVDSDQDGSSPAAGDCDDTRPGLFPGAPEVCGDGFDQDCDGTDRRCAPVGDVDLDGGLSLQLDDHSGSAAGDLDGDGLADLIVGGDEGLTVMMAPLPIGLYDLYWVYWAAPGITPGGGLVETGDTDGDGRADVLYTTDVSGELRLVAGADLAEESATITLASTPRRMLLADTTGDGTDDPVLVEPGLGESVLIFADPLAPGLSAADASHTIVSDPLTWLADGATAAGDVDGDGLADLLLGDGWQDGAGSNRGRAWLMLAPLAAATDLSAAAATVDGVEDDGRLGAGAGIPGDVTGDGAVDLVIGSPREGLGGVVRLFASVPGPGAVGGGDLLFDAPDTRHELGIGISEPMDLDGDGQLDLGLGDARAEGPGSTGGAMFVFYGPVPLGGTLSTSDADAAVYGTGVGRSIRTAGDTDGDGTDDVLLVPWLMWGGLL